MTGPSDARGRRTFLPVLSMCHQQIGKPVYCSLNLTTTTDFCRASLYDKVQYMLRKFCLITFLMHSVEMAGHSTNLLPSSFFCLFIRYTYKLHEKHHNTKYTENNKEKYTENQCMSGNIFHTQF